MSVAAPCSSFSAEALIEAALLTQAEALSDKQLRQLCEPPLSQDKLIDVLASLQQRWQNRALRLVQTAGGWRFQATPAAFERLSSLAQQRAPRYSHALMETLAIIAYRQPVTRSDIEAIRGVSVSSQVMQTLQERGWIEVVGRREVLGRPSLWGTTQAFLSDLQLNHLDELPPLAELGESVLPEITHPAAIAAAEESAEKQIGEQ